MQISHDIVINTTLILDQLKFWIPVVSIGWGVFKAWSWVREIREKDLADVKTGMSELKTSVQETNTAIQKLETNLAAKVDSQTVSIVDQLKELRSDFRTFYTKPVAAMAPAMAKEPTVRKQRTKKTVK